MNICIKFYYPFIKLLKPRTITQRKLQLLPTVTLVLNSINDQQRFLRFTTTSKTQIINFCDWSLFLPRCNSQWGPMKVSDTEPDC